MKKIFYSLFAVMMGLAPLHMDCLATDLPTPSPTTPPAPTSDLGTTLQPSPKPSPVPPPDLDIVGKRDMPAPLFCSISREHGVQTDPTLFGIISYGIWDESGEMCTASFIDELSFVNAVFSLPEGSYQIRLETTDCYYCGIISIY